MAAVHYTNSQLIMTETHFSKRNNEEKPICERARILEFVSAEAAKAALENSSGS